MNAFFGGPIMLQDLCGLLIRFSNSPVAVVADIEKAFLQIEQQIQERDVTRFFWLKDPTVPSAENNLQLYRFCRVPFGIVCSPFLLAATVKYHLKQVGSAVSSKICENLYVNNVVTGVDSIQEANQFYQEAKVIFQRASMNLREWASNSSEFFAQIPECDRVNGTSIKVLGVKWNLNDDLLSINIGCQEKLERASTKRQMLQSLAMIFDPLGFFAPLTLKAKILIHQLWNRNMDWDEVVDEREQREWKVISKELMKIPDKEICRYIGSFGKEIASVQLLCFCDASALAYSAAVYAKTNSDGENQVNLIFAKSRLPPSKSLSIPRLELLATVIGTRCIRFVEQQLRVPVASKILWTDSQCVLHWMASKKPQTVFVENRLREIRKSPSVSFRYITSQQNPADIATRGKFSYEEMNKSIWWNGPSWLKLKEDNWSVWPYNICAKDDYHPEINSEIELIVNVDSADKAPYGIEIEKYSSITKLYRITAWMSRFLNKLRKRCNRVGNLDSSEITAAKGLWDCYVQHEYFPEVFQAIRAKKRCNLKEQLNIKEDDKGVLRCYGRFQNSDLTKDAKFPKLLPKRGDYTVLIIRRFHEALLHCKVQHTLSQIRQEYWIPQGRAAVRSIISKCVVCRRFDGGPYRSPSFPNLPASRVCRSSPFSYVGVDYMGPLNVKIHPSGIKKVWICLFTCMAVRAVHLELVEDLSTDQFLLSFRRFIARRGKPFQIISDNASQFKMSKIALDRLWGSIISDPDVTSYVSSQGILWKFIIERAPWMGGFYERLVGTVKRALKKSIGRLMTALTEVEAVINSRPLFYVSDDDPQRISVSPADFLSLNPKAGIPMLSSTADDPNFVPMNDSAGNLLETRKKGHKLLEEFWKVWKEDYLASLRERCCNFHKEGRIISDQLPKVNDSVLVQDSGLARGSWKMGLIESLIPSSDGQIRAAKIRFSSGRVLNRPLKLLYPLESDVHGGGGQFEGHGGGSQGEVHGGGGHGQVHGGGGHGQLHGGGGQFEGQGGGSQGEVNGGGGHSQVHGGGGHGQVHGGGGHGQVRGGCGHGQVHGGGGQVEGHGGGGQGGVHGGGGNGQVHGGGGHGQVLGDGSQGEVHGGGGKIEVHGGGGHSQVHGGGGHGQVHGGGSQGQVHGGGGKIEVHGGGGHSQVHGGGGHGQVHGGGGQGHFHGAGSQNQANTNNGSASGQKRTVSKRSAAIKAGAFLKELIKNFDV